MKKDEGGSSQGDKCRAYVLSSVGGQLLIFLWHFAQTFALVHGGPPVAKVLNNLVFQGDVQKALWSGLFVYCVVLFFIHFGLFKTTHCRSVQIDLPYKEYEVDLKQRINA